jgi:hypothetical protein
MMEGRLPDTDLGAFVLPVRFMRAPPHVLTVVILAGCAGKGRG